MDLSFISVPLTAIVSAYAGLWLSLSLVYLLKKCDKIEARYSATKVSILVPARDEAQVVTKLLSDLDRQTWNDCEIILIAHNCNDNTAEVARNLNTTKPLKVLELKTNVHGKALALEHGLKEATGSVIAVFDADNRVPSDFIEKSLQYIRAGYDGVQAKISSKNPTESLLTYLQDAEFLVYPKVYCGAKHLLGYNSGIGGTGIMVTRKAIDEVGGFRNVLIEDYDILIRLTLAKKKIAYGEDVVTFDEKVHTWRGLIRQRARWLAGYFELWKRFSLKQKVKLLRYPVDFLYFFNPVCIIALLGSHILLLLHIANSNITFWSIPFVVWIAIMVTINGCFTIMLRQDKISWRQSILIPWQLVVFGFHWFIAFFDSFNIKGWDNTKTEHGFGVQREKCFCYRG